MQLSPTQRYSSLHLHVSDENGRLWRDGETHGNEQRVRQGAGSSLKTDLRLQCEQPARAHTGPLCVQTICRGVVAGRGRGT